jgi:hypothetical protein
MLNFPFANAQAFFDMAKGTHLSLTRDSGKMFATIRSKEILGQSGCVEYSPHELAWAAAGVHTVIGYTRHNSLNFPKLPQKVPGSKRKSFPVFLRG